MINFKILVLNRKDVINILGIQYINVGRDNSLKGNVMVGLLYGLIS